MSRRKYWRTSTDGCIRFNRDFSRIGVGRITQSSRTKNPTEFERRNHLLSKLAESSQLEVLRAFRSGDIAIEQLVEADRQHRLRTSDLLADIAMRRNLWETVAAVLPRMGRQAVTRKRYKVSLDALREKATSFLSEFSAVSDLARVPWDELRNNWGGSAADWNHLRRAVSAFLTVALSDKYHPVRRAVMHRFPKAVERERVPQLTPADFLRIVNAVPDHAKPCYMVLQLTGMRVGEYLKCSVFQLDRDACRIIVPGTKTDRSAGTVYVAPEFWRWVEIGVPSPLKYQWMRTHWKRACARVGMPDVRLHDLRHCYAQWASDAGIPEAKIQVAMRHASGAMTRRYSVQRAARDVGNVIGQVLTRAAL